MLRLGTLLTCVVIGSSNCFGQSSRDDVDAHASAALELQSDVSLEALLAEVERLKADDPANTVALIAALTKLGFAQYSNKDLAAADVTFSEAADLAEEKFGLTDIRL